VPALSQLPAAVARVACSGETHTIRWEAGDLVALNHADPQGERTLAALGGQSCPCLDVLGAWARQREDATLLSALSRGPQDPVQAAGLSLGRFAAYRAMGLPRNVASAGLRAAIRNSGAVYSSAASMTGFAVPPGSLSPTTSTSSTPEEDKVLLAGLGYALTLRMAATVTATLLSRPKSPPGVSPQPALEVSLFGRASAALRTWLGTPELELNLEAIEPEAKPCLSWDGSGPVHVALPLQWVMTVWGQDLTVVAGRFCLGVTEWSGTRITLMSVGSDLGSPRPLMIEIPDGSD